MRYSKWSIDLAGDHEERRDRRLRAGCAGRLRMRLQRQEQWLRLLGLRLPQRR